MHLDANIQLIQPGLSAQQSSVSSLQRGGFESIVSGDLAKVDLDKAKQVIDGLCLTDADKAKRTIDSLAQTGQQPAAGLVQVGFEGPKSSSTPGLILPGSNPSGLQKLTLVDAEQAKREFETLQQGKLTGAVLERLIGDPNAAANLASVVSGGGIKK